MPLRAPECFDGHARPTEIDLWTVWVCPQDGELVFPGDVSRDDILDANLRHPLVQPTEALPWRGLVQPTEAPPWRNGFDLPDQTLGVVTFPGRRAPFLPAFDEAVPPAAPPPSPAEGSSPERTGPSVVVNVSPQQSKTSPAPLPSPGSRASDPNDSLVTISAPVLAGFSLASVVLIDTSTSLSGRPEAMPAVASFAASAVLLVFSIQMLALCALPGLASSRKLRSAKAWLYEFGVLAFLAGLGLFLWPTTWSAAPIAGLAVVGLAVVSDLILVGVAWCKRDRWAEPPQVA